VTAVERRKLRRILTGQVDVLGNVVGTRSKQLEKQRKAERKARRRKGELATAVSDLLERAKVL
jgi:hypothetical protein